MAGKAKHESNGTRPWLLAAALAVFAAAYMARNHQEHLAPMVSKLQHQVPEFGSQLRSVAEQVGGA